MRVNTLAPFGKDSMMAMVTIAPAPVEVRCGWLDGRPRSVRLGGETLPVMAVSRVRHERAAYPRAVGPRTLYEVVTPKARLRLGYRHRERRWSVEGVDGVFGELVGAARAA